MWDPDELAEIPVIVDRLQASGDPLGEWLAIRVRLEARDEVPAVERRALRRRARALREQLGARLILADDPRLGRPHAIRELGLLVDVSLAEAGRERLAELLDRPDAALILRLRLRGDPVALRGCVELLLEPRRATSLRELALERVGDEGGPDLHAELQARAAELGEALPGLFALHVDARAVALPFAPARAEPWSRERRTTLGRALAHPNPGLRRAALELLREHGSDANQLRSALLSIIVDDPDPQVRKAAFAVVPRLGPGAPALLALAVDAAADRDDPLLREWLAAARS